MNIRWSAMTPEQKHTKALRWREDKHLARFTIEELIAQRDLVEEVTDIECEFREFEREAERYQEMADDTRPLMEDARAKREAHQLVIEAAASAREEQP